MYGGGFISPPGRHGYQEGLSGTLKTVGQRSQGKDTGGGDVGWEPSAEESEMMNGEVSSLVGERTLKNLIHGKQQIDQFEATASSWTDCLIDPPGFRDVAICTINANSTNPREFMAVSLF